MLAPASGDDDASICFSCSILARSRAQTLHSCLLFPLLLLCSGFVVHSHQSLSYVKKVKGLMRNSYEISLVHVKFLAFVLLCKCIAPCSLLRSRIELSKVSESE